MVVEAHSQLGPLARLPTGLLHIRVATSTANAKWPLRRCLCLDRPAAIRAQAVDPVDPLGFHRLWLHSANDTRASVPGAPSKPAIEDIVTFSRYLRALAAQFGESVFHTAPERPQLVGIWSRKHNVGNDRSQVVPLTLYRGPSAASKTTPSERRWYAEDGYHAWRR